MVPNMAPESNARRSAQLRCAKTPLRYFSGALVAIIAPLVTLATLLTAPPAAATAPVAAGDIIVQGQLQCTLGYVYRVSGHTLGVSAGHCHTAGGGEVVDKEARVVGRTVSATYLPDPNNADGPPLRDWWLIDFGDVAWSDHIAHTNYQVIGYVNAKDSDWVCHYGYASAGEVCGLVTKVDNPLITVTQIGRKGDSGGPTYMKVSGNAVAAVGLWQGHFFQPSPHGYVMSLPAALDYFRKNVAS